jgi:hypothetical protein
MASPRQARLPFVFSKNFGIQQDTFLSMLSSKNWGGGRGWGEIHKIEFKKQLDAHHAFEFFFYMSC